MMVGRRPVPANPRHGREDRLDPGVAEVRFELTQRLEERLVLRVA